MLFTNIYDKFLACFLYWAGSMHTLVLRALPVSSSVESMELDAVHLSVFPFYAFVTFFSHPVKIYKVF